MASLPTVGRWLYALPCIVFGALHFLNAPGMVSMVPIPGGVFWVYATGVGLIASTLAILSGVQAVLALRLLGFMILTFALTIHLPEALGATDPAAMHASLGNFLKDTMLGGAGLFMSGHVQGPAEV